MGLSDSEKTAVSSLWDKIAPEANKLGAESMSRLFQSHPETKSFFSRYDVSPGSQDLLIHGGKIFMAIGEASKNLDSLSKYQDLHTNKLKLNAGHIKLLNASIVDVLSAHYAGDFVQAAWEKFLNEVASFLTSS